LFEFVKEAADQKLDGAGDPAGFPLLNGEHLAAAISTVARLAAHEMDLATAERHMECQKDSTPQSYGNYQ
jgi:hypothetical protein